MKIDRFWGTTQAAARAAYKEYYHLLRMQSSVSLRYADRWASRSAGNAFKSRCMADTTFTGWSKPYKARMFAQKLAAYKARHEPKPPVVGWPF